MKTALPLVGHSIGAALGSAVAEDMPQAIGGIVALDGLPVFRGTETLAQMAAADPALFGNQQQA